MPLGEFSIIVLSFWVIFGENRKMSKEEKLGKNRAFAMAKSFAATKATSPW